MPSSAETGGREQGTLRSTPATRQLAGLKLDELLAGVQARLTEISRTSDRLQSLLDAVLAVSAQLEFDTTLRRTVRAALDLVEARSGVLTVVNPEGGPPERVAMTLDSDSESGSGSGESDSGTEGGDAAGTVVDVPRARAPESRTALAVPVRVREETVGTLYVRDRRGGGEFSADDEIVLRSLAVSAGAAVENARLFEQTRVRGRWLEAVAAVNSELLAGASPARSLQRLADVAAELSGSLATVVLLDEGGALAVGAVSGPVSGLSVGEVISASGVLTDVLRTVEPTVLDELSRADTPLPSAFAEEFGPAVVAPLRSAEGVKGVLLALRERGASGFSRPEMSLVSSFAAQATLALRFADKQEGERAIALLADRDRIAQDLHDHVIQRLFAVGMSLQGVVGDVGDAYAAGRIRDAVRRLDQTVREIRTSIFNLHSLGTSASNSLRRRLLDIASSPPDGSPAPSIRIGGAVDTLVPEPLGRDIECVVREGIARLTRRRTGHGGIPEIVLDIDVGDTVTVEVTVGGVTAPPEGGPWLDEIRRRARAHGGEADVHSARGAVRLIWAVPLPEVATTSP
ncbi:GAF domain-containing protein [Saccharomonospora xinjiangensis]|uniref:Histidine kinase with GAF domain n=1 Tax=Saccharomonospora xinjiangensis XJ-54 TaxID=882086 RepID=I0V7G4_9PSEU|nr:GAF domain-containing protein [Saccharomonospora xinjiangensis]EID56067.1 histidine kinase with GAF domain [Saccharomonospora xinjiangensis XJ-54]